MVDFNEENQDNKGKMAIEELLGLIGANLLGVEGKGHLPLEVVGGRDYEDFEAEIGDEGVTGEEMRIARELGELTKQLKEKMKEAYEMGLDCRIKQSRFVNIETMGFGINLELFVFKRRQV